MLALKLALLALPLVALGCKSACDTEVFVDPCPVAFDVINYCQTTTNCEWVGAAECTPTTECDYGVFHPGADLHVQLTDIDTSLGTRDAAELVYFNGTGSSDPAEAKMSVDGIPGKPISIRVNAADPTDTVFTFHDFPKAPKVLELGDKKELFADLMIEIYLIDVECREAHPVPNCSP